MLHVSSIRRHRRVGYVFSTAEVEASCGGWSRSIDPEEAAGH